MGSPADLTLSTSQAPSTNATTNTATATTTTTVLSKSSPSSFVGDRLQRMRKLEEYLQSLEDERRKIEAFKRELPLCMQLLDETIENSKEQLSAIQALRPTNLRGPLQLLQVVTQSSSQQLVQDERDTGTTVSSPAASGGHQRGGLEFIPLKRISETQQRRDDEGDDDDDDDDDDRELGDQSDSCLATRGIDIGRKAWMAEAQIWTQQSEPMEVHHEKEISSPEDVVGRQAHFGQSPEQEQSSVTSSRLFFSSTQRPVGAFLPFIRGQQQVIAVAPLLSHSTNGTGSAAAADLSLSSLDQMSSPTNGHGFGGGAESEVGSIDVVSLKTADQNQALDAQAYKEMQGPESNGASGAGSTSGGIISHSHRKSRRCWSPELHRRFVSALQQLGGSQVATPKQIRELMKVDGLTNDEVKSHLQKYRLHTRRPSPSPQSVSQQPPPQLVVLGGIWVPPEYAAVAAAAAQPTSGVYNPSQQSVYCQPSHPQDYFVHNNSTGSSGGQNVHHHPPTSFEPQKSTSVSQSSPQGPLQLTSQLSGGAQEPSLDDSGGEDVKSDSTSWKGRQQEDEGKETANGANKQSSVSKEDNKAGKLRDNTPGGEIFADHNSPVLELQISCGTSDIDMGVKDVA